VVFLVQCVGGVHCVFGIGLFYTVLLLVGCQERFRSEQGGSISEDVRSGPRKHVHFLLGRIQFTLGGINLAHRALEQPILREIETNIAALSLAIQNG